MVESARVVFNGTGAAKGSAVRSSSSSSFLSLRERERERASAGRGRPAG